MAGRFGGAAGLVLAAACGRVGFEPVAAKDGPAGAAAIYASTDRTLYTIDPSTLAPTMLFDLTRSDAVTPQIADLAVDSTGRLIATEQFAYQIYRVDLASGALTPISTSLQVMMYGAAFGAGDVLYAAGADSNLYTIDPDTGTTTLVGAIGAQPAGDIVWTGSELLMSAKATTSIMMRIDLATGAGTAVGDSGRPEIYGLAMIAGQLIGFSNQGETDSIDLATGTGSVLATSSNVWGGAASRP